MATKKKTHRKKMKVKLELIRADDPAAVDWLYKFIHAEHSIPTFMMPTREELMDSHRKFFRALSVGSRRSQVVGISGYEVKSPFLVETQKTIVAKEFRGAGWGPLISDAIEETVKKAGYYKIKTCVYADNYAMILIKLKQGYIIEGYHRDHDGPGLHEYSLGKVIQKKRPRPSPRTRTRTRTRTKSGNR